MATFVSHQAEILAGVDREFTAAGEDLGNIAAGKPGAPHDTGFEKAGPMDGRIGSRQPYARAQELGAYIRPTRRRALRFHTGQFSKRARLPAKRYLESTMAQADSVVLGHLRRVG